MAAAFTLALLPLLLPLLPILLPIILLVDPSGVFERFQAELVIPFTQFLNELAGLSWQDILNFF